MVEDIGEVPFRGCRVSGVIQLTVPRAIIAGACSGIALEARSRSVVGGVRDRGCLGRNGFSVATRSVGARRARSRGVDRGRAAVVKSQGWYREEEEGVAHDEDFL